MFPGFSAAQSAFTPVSSLFAAQTPGFKCCPGTGDAAIAEQIAMEQAKKKKTAEEVGKSSLWKNFKKKIQVDMIH